MTDDLRMLDELEALEKRATPVPWSVVRSVTCGHLRAGHNMNTAEPAKEWTNHDIDLIEDARNALPTLLRLARRGLAAGAAEAEEELSEQLFLMMSKTLRDTADALKGPPGDLRGHSFHDLPQVAHALRSELDAALSPAPAAEKRSPGPKLIEGLTGLRDRIVDNVIGNTDAGGAA